MIKTNAGNYILWIGLIACGIYFIIAITKSLLGNNNMLKKIFGDKNV